MKNARASKNRIRGKIKLTKKMMKMIGLMSEMIELIKLIGKVLNGNTNQILTVDKERKGHTTKDNTILIDMDNKEPNNHSEQRGHKEFKDRKKHKNLIGHKGHSKYKGLIEHKGHKV